LRKKDSGAGHHRYSPGQKDIELIIYGSKERGHWCFLKISNRGISLGETRNCFGLGDDVQYGKRKNLIELEKGKRKSF